MPTNIPYVHQFPNNSTNNIKGWETKLIYCFYGASPGLQGVDYITYLKSLDTSNMSINLFDAIDDYERINGILVSKGIPQCLNSEQTNPSLSKTNAGIPFWYFKTGKTFRIRARLYVEVTNTGLKFCINGGVKYKLRGDQTLYNNFTQFQNLAWANGSPDYWHTFLNSEVALPAIIPVDLELVYTPIMVQSKNNNYYNDSVDKVTFPSFKCNGYYQYAHYVFQNSDNTKNSYVPVYGLYGGDINRSDAGLTEYITYPDYPTNPTLPLNLGNRENLPSSQNYLYNDRLAFWINFIGSETDQTRLTNIVLDYLTIEELS